MMGRTLIVLAAGAVGLASVGTAAQAALVIEFDGTQGYTTGTLSNQLVSNPPDNTTRWTNPTQTSLAVDATNGVLNFSNTTASYVGIDTPLNQTLLGFNPAAPADLVEYSFRFNFLGNTGHTNGAGGISATENSQFVLRNTSNQELMSFRILGSGQMVAARSGGNTNVGSVLTSSTGFVEFKALLDFSNNTFSVYRDGGEIASNLGFVNGGTIGNFRYGQNFNRTGGEFQWQLDDLTVAVIPEPASLGLIGLAGLTLLRRRR